MLDKAFSSSLFADNHRQLSKLLVYRSEMESTSLWARQALSLEDGQSGLLVVTDYQSSGKGRRGGCWSAAPNSSLLFTLVVEPELERCHWPKLGLATGLAVVNVLCELGFPAELKWPNDVWLDGVKCCGVLAEVVNESVLLGVGLNLTGSPEEGTCLSDHIQNFCFSKEDLLGRLVSEIIRLGSMVDHERVIEQCNAVHALNGKSVSLIRGNDKILGVVESITPNGALRLQTVDGACEVMQAHEVRLVE